MNYGKKGVRAKQKALNSKSQKWGRKIALTCVKVMLAAVVGIGICGVAAGIGVFRGILSSTPTIRLSDVVAVGEATIVYDKEGNEIDQYVSTNSNRLSVGMDEIPDYMGKAFVAIEDERFYQHNGIDFKSILRAGYQFLKTGGEEAQGASTITQQLLKNTVFTDWTSEGNNKIKKIKRKIQEQYLALELEKRMSKRDILELYMNSINLGQNTLGVQAASMRYFNKPVSELNLSECAVIAGITQNPSKYNPITHPEDNADRRTKVLNDMLDQGWIDQDEYDEAMADDVYSRIKQVNETTESDSINSYFVDALIDQVTSVLMEEKSRGEEES